MVSWLEHPLTRGLDLDDPQTTEIRKQIIRSKSFLKRIYQEWYSLISTEICGIDGPVLELGSGAGFFDEYISDLITSEIMLCRDVACVLDGQMLPFASGSLRAIVMVDVLHHIPQCELLFQDASRCIKRGGKMVFIEPWVTNWSRFVFGHLHHEPFLPDTEQWSFPSSGPLSGANGALPWILFHRDRQLFQEKFPEWQIQTIKPIMPFSYLVSGGVSLRGFVPGGVYPLVRFCESCMAPINDYLCMFAFITLVKR